MKRKKKGNDVIRIEVLYEDNHYIAVNKPAGVLVHEDETGDETLADAVKTYIKHTYNKPGNVFLGVCHRLDRPVSGCIIFAKTSKGLTKMNELFKNRTIEKEYWAITDERPEPLSGRLKHFLLKDRTKNKTKAYEKKGRRTASAKEAILDYELASSLGNHYLVKVFPKTGRPHQIRVQLAENGTPIRGDKKYGYVRHNKNGSIHLHSRRLSFTHPVKKEAITIIADMPNDQVWDMFKGMA